MPDDLLVFATPVLKGPRFDNNPDPANVTIPVEVLPMFEAYRQAVLETARTLFHGMTGENVPRGFDDSFELRLGHVESGSTIPHLVLKASMMAALAGHPAIFPTSGPNLFEQAREVVSETIEAASERRAIPRNFPRRSLVKLRQIGEKLQEGESVTLRAPGSRRAPVYHRTLKDQIREIEEQQVSRVEVFRGPVVAMDTSARSFRILTRDGEKIEATYGEGVGSEQEVVTLLRDRRFRRAELTVDATFDGAGKLRGVTQILGMKAVELTNEATVKQIDDRFRTLEELREGWLGEGKGKTLPLDELPWAKDILLEMMADDGIPKPRLYPTPDGNLEAEWTQGHWEVSATVNLRTHSAELHALNVVSDNEDEEDVDLDAPDGRAAMVAFLRQYLGAAEGAR
jgi:hypothetical protein